MTVITLSDGTKLDVSAFPLPEGSEDVVMNRGQIAQAMNTSEVTITTWISKGFPVLSKGGNGTAYEFQLSHCYAWRKRRDLEHKRSMDAADEAAAQMRLEFQNLDDDQAESERGLSAKQIMEIAEADYKRNRAAEQRGELVRVDRMREMQEQQLIDMRQAVMSIPDFAEQEFGLSPVQAEKLQKRCEGALIEMGTTMRRHLPVGTVSEPVDLAQAKTERLI
ncbi:MAG: hypothetical protein ABJL67_13525 [Sulfitobacter sp.]